tara:strand:- start:262 stop:1032 length:771 start_codon:yes stop_codon:yes gene_type:complete
MALQGLGLTDFTGGATLDIGRVVEIGLKCMDLTLLDAEATPEQLRNLARKGSEHGVAGVCVLPQHLDEVRTELPAGIELVAAAGLFPLPNPDLKERLEDIDFAVERDATEIDLVLDFESAKEGKVTEARLLLDKLVLACHDRRVKVIIESSVMDEAETRDACRIAMSAGAAFVKSCTGTRGGCSELAARVIAEEALRYEKRTGIPVGIKLSGGISNLQNLALLIDAVEDGFPGFKFDKDRFRIGASGLLEELVRHR